MFFLLAVSPSPSALSSRTPCGCIFLPQANVIGVIDTGTSLIAGPPDVVNPIIAQINASTDCECRGRALKCVRLNRFA